MTYNPNIPQPTDFLDTSQGDIQTNFSVSNTVMGINHYAFNDATSNKGKHKFVQMPNLLANPSTDAGEGRIYTKLDSSSHSQLFYTQNADLKEYQLTRAIPSSSSLFGSNPSYGTPPAGFTQTGGWTFLPGNLIMQYGFYGKSGALGANGTIQFPFIFPSSIYSLSASLNRTSSGNQSITIDVVSLSNFTFLSSSSQSDGIYWMAIGV